MELKVFFVFAAIVGIVYIIFKIINKRISRGFK
jgi:hypothetical protein